MLSWIIVETLTDHLEIPLGHNRELSEWPSGFSPKKVSVDDSEREKPQFLAQFS
jgi:hypothetical protein